MGIDTSIFQSASTTAHCLKPEALGESGVSLSVADDLIEPNPGPDYVLDIYRENGTRVVTWGAGSSYSVPAGHYPANSDTTFPLSSGNYYTVLTKPGEPAEIGCCFSVEFLALCDRDSPISIRFEGDSSAITAFDFDIDVGDLTEVTLLFTPLDVPDQVQVLDNDNVVVFDSGLVTGSQLEFPVDLTTGDFADGKIRIVITSGGAPGQITVFSLSVGCCEGVECALPILDPVFAMIYNDDGCIASGVVLMYAFYRTADTFTEPIGYNLSGANPGQLDGPSGNPCSQQLFTTDTESRSNTFGLACSNTVLSPSFTCLDIAPSADYSMVDNGASLTLDFSNAASYATAAATLQQLDTWAQQHMTNTTSAADWVFFVSDFGWNSSNLCGSDVGSTARFEWYWRPGYFTYNPTGGASGNGQIVYTPAPIFPDPDNCCVSRTFTVQQQIDAVEALLSNVESFTTQLNIFRLPSEPQFVSPLPDAAGVVANVFQSGIVTSSCGNDQGVNDYNWRLNTSDPIGTFEVWRGPIGSGVQVIPPGGLMLYIGSGTDGMGLTWAAANQRYIYLQAANGLNEGWRIQEVDYATATFDLSFVGGGLAETFADGPALAARLSALIGSVVVHVPHYDMFYSSTSLGQPILIPTTV